MESLTQQLYEIDAVLRTRDWSAKQDIHYDAIPQEMSALTPSEQKFVAEVMQSGWAVAECGRMMAMQLHMRSSAGIDKHFLTHIEVLTKHSLVLSHWLRKSGYKPGPFDTPIYMPIPIKLELSHPTLNELVITYHALLQLFGSMVWYTASWLKKRLLMPTVAFIGEMMRKDYEEMQIYLLAYGQLAFGNAEASEVHTIVRKLYGQLRAPVPETVGLDSRKMQQFNQYQANEVCSDWSVPEIAPQDPKDAFTPDW